MAVNDPYILLSPAYEEEFVRRYKKQPKFIPIGFVGPNKVHNIPKRDHMRTWIGNPNYTKKVNIENENDDS